MGREVYEYQARTTTRKSSCRHNKHTNYNNKWMIMKKKQLELFSHLKFEQKKD